MRLGCAGEVEIISYLSLTAPSRCADIPTYLEKLVRPTYESEPSMAPALKRDQRLRAERLGFRVDEPTKALIERAAQLERRKVTDFCMTALTDAARRTIAEHETLVLSDRDRAVFEALINPPAPNERLQRAFAEHKRRVIP